MKHSIELLQQIAENTASNNSLWMAVISGASAILGASVTALYTYCSAKRTAKSQEKIEANRLRANIVTTERLRWLQDIRQRLSHLYQQMDMQYSFLKRPIAPANLQDILDDFSAKVMEEANMITLMLNPEKAQQLKLRNAVQEALNFQQGCFVIRSTGIRTFNDARYTEIKTSAFDSLTIIGHETWAQIKVLS